MVQTAAPRQNLYGYTVCVMQGYSHTSLQPHVCTLTYACDNSFTKQMHIKLVLHTVCTSGSNSTSGDIKSVHHACGQYHDGIRLELYSRL